MSWSLEALLVELLAFRKEEKRRMMVEQSRLGTIALGAPFSSGSEKGLFVEPFVQYRHK